MGIFDDLMAKKEKLSVIGLGYVGMPLAVEFSKNFDVIGFDIDVTRIDEYKNGIDKTGEVGGETIKNCNVDWTSDPARLRNAKFHVIAVPTPINQDKTPDLSPVVGASVTVGRNLVEGSIVVYESTVYPGVTEDTCVSILERESGLTCGRDFKVGYSPERINPGDKVHTLRTICKVVSGIDEMALEQIGKVYETVVDAGIFSVSSIKVAEAIKVVENSQRDINIAFMNELAMVFDRMDIDTNEVIAGMNTKWNALHFRPGLVGGHCIGVDPYYFTYEAEKLGYHSQIILAGRKVNDGMGEFVAESAIKQLVLAGLAPANAKVVILGLTFKENCPDCRNSKVGGIIDKLREYGIEPMVVDPWADSQDAKASYGVTLVDINEIKDAACVIAAVAHKEFIDMGVEGLFSLFPSGRENTKKIVIDVKGVFDGKEIQSRGFRYWNL